MCMCSHILTKIFITCIWPHKVWDLREGQILYMIKGHEGATTSAMFSPTGDHFASGSQDEQVKEAKVIHLSNANSSNHK